VKCSKGYYVRSLARDLGEAMQCPAHLGALRRIRNGVFGIELAVVGRSPPSPLLPIADAARLAMQTVDLTDVGLQRARHGKFWGSTTLCSARLHLKRANMWHGYIKAN